MGTGSDKDGFGVKTPACRTPVDRRTRVRAHCRRCEAPDVKAVPLDDEHTLAWVCSSCGCQTIAKERRATNTTSAGPLARKTPD